jgi:hypothetical protein
MPPRQRTEECLNIKIAIKRLKNVEKSFLLEKVPAKENRIQEEIKSVLIRGGLAARQFRKLQERKE